MYIVALNVALAAAYFFLYAFVPYFFEGRFAPLRWKAVSSIAAVVLVNLAAHLGSAVVSDAELSNRLLHVFGGGVTAFVLFFFVVRDAKLDIGRFRFFTLGFLITLALGTANELLEFLLQTFTPRTFAGTVTDTWLDLLSNVIGALIGGTILTFFVRPKKRR